MKKIYGFAAICAAMTLASCSNNDEPNVVTPSEGDGVTKAYLAINLSAPADDTRGAVDEATYQNMEKGMVNPGEYAVANVQFAIFGESKKLITITECYEDFTWSNSTDADVDKESSKKVLEIAQKDNEKVGYVMAIVNSPDISSLGFTAGTTTIEQVRSKLGDFKTITGDDDKTYLVMSNSAYSEKETVGTEEVDYNAYAKSFRGHVYSSFYQASEDPVDIYVERVAARVDLTNKGASKANKVTIENATVDGKDATLTVDITGVDFIYAAAKSPLVKGINSIDSDIASADWFKGTHRTHWADAASLTWVDKKDETSTSKSDYAHAYYSTANDINGAVGETTKSFYLHENTTAKPTYVVITGEIKVGGTKTEIYQLWNDGKYYTLDGAKKELCGYLRANGYHYYLNNNDVESEKSIDPSDVDIVASTTTDFEGYIAINITAKDKYDNELKLCKNKQAVNVTGYNTTTKKFTMVADLYKALVYGGGNTYYYCPIQPDNAEDQGGKEGLVRNHIYDINFGTIKGLGVPLFDPSNELLPKEPETNNDKTPKWYFGAKINILKWKVYGQNMNFGK